MLVTATGGRKNDKDSQHHAPIPRLHVGLTTGGHRRPHTQATPATRMTQASPLFFQITRTYNGHQMSRCKNNMRLLGRLVFSTLHACNNAIIIFACRAVYQRHIITRVMLRPRLRAPDDQINACLDSLTYTDRLLTN